MLKSPSCMILTIHKITSAPAVSTAAETHRNASFACTFQLFLLLNETRGRKDISAILKSRILVLLAAKDYSSSKRTMDRPIIRRGPILLHDPQDIGETPEKEHQPGETILPMEEADMKKFILAGHPWWNLLFIVFFLFAAAIAAGCGIESSNRPEDATGTQAEDISAPILRAPEDGSVINTTSPVMDWDDVTGAAVFQIQVSSTDDFATLEIDREVSTSSFTATDFILNQGLHFWRVRAKGSEDQLSPWSRVPSFTVASIRGKESPQAMITYPKADTTIFIGGYIDCAGSLTDGSPPSACVWEFGDLGTCENNPAPDAVRFNEEGIYLVRFTAFTQDGAESSDEVTITVVDGSPVQVAPDDGYAASDHTLEFSWEPMEGADSYILFIPGAGEAGELNVPVQGVSREISFDDPGGYSWCVYAIDSHGNAGACSELRTFTIP